VRGLEDRGEGPRGNFLRRHVSILVPRSYDANAQGLPGPYKSSVAATFNLEQTLKGSGVEPAAGTELWDIRSQGGTIELRLQYQRGVAMRQKQETRPRSAVDPTILRIYRVDQGLDLVRSVPAKIDRVQAYSLRVTVPTCARYLTEAKRAETPIQEPARPSRAIAVSRSRRRSA
jgi:hypothetical protein